MNACLLCSEPTVAIDATGPRTGVTSDCRPWPRLGNLVRCRSCGCVQKQDDAQWRADADAIYRSYAVYHQAQGAEQAVFDPVTGQAAARSARIVERLGASHALPARGRLLDVGCSNGAFLRAFGAARPDWSLTGNDLHDTYRLEVEAIPGVESFHAGPLAAVDGTFDLISAIHVLEHVPEPRAFLEGMASKLNPGGALVIQVPDHARNPFDLMIVDHRAHFTTATLAALLGRARLCADVAATWVPKELSAVARPSDAMDDGAMHASAQAAERGLRWLDALVSQARELLGGGRLGLFGTSIAAVWLDGALGGAAAFFVDEDPARQGHALFDRPVLAPSDVPAGATVLIALPNEIAEGIARRVARPEVAYHVPRCAG